MFKEAADYPILRVSKVIGEDHYIRLSIRDKPDHRNKTYLEQLNILLHHQLNHYYRESMAGSFGPLHQDTHYFFTYFISYNNNIKHNFNLKICK